MKVEEERGLPLATQENGTQHNVKGRQKRLGHRFRSNLYAHIKRAFHSLFLFFFFGYKINSSKWNFVIYT